MAVLNFVAENFDTIATLVLAVVAATPTKDDDGIAGRVVNIARLIFRR